MPFRTGDRTSLEAEGTIWYASSLAMDERACLLRSTGGFARWAMVAHHILHRGYDRVPDIPFRLTSKGFARGWRRHIDWLDRDTWAHEHNTLHHYKLGETLDPDQPEEVLSSLRGTNLPTPFRYALLAIAAATWKPAYYAPNTAIALHRAHQRRNGEEPMAQSLVQARVWSPFSQPGFRLWARSYLPYATIRFGLLPLSFFLLGLFAYFAALANLHAFLMIVPNHAGDDLYCFDSSITDRGEFYLRQMIGSANYRTGGDRNDFLHGWLNYQIEHHVFPDMTMLQYQKAQPLLQAIATKHGVPYVQESVWVRLRKLIHIAMGRADMPFYDPPALSTAE